MSAEEKRKQEKRRAFEEAERLAQKSHLTEADIAPIVAKINKHMAEHAEKLLAEQKKREQTATP